MTNFNKEVYVDFTAAQIKTLSFLAYIVRIFQVNQLSLSSSIKRFKLKYSTFSALIEGSQMDEKHRYLILELSWFLSCLRCLTKGMCSQKNVISEMFIWNGSLLLCQLFIYLNIFFI